MTELETVPLLLPHDDALPLGVCEDEAVKLNIADCEAVAHTVIVVFKDALPVPVAHLDGVADREDDDVVVIEFDSFGVAVAQRVGAADAESLCMAVGEEVALPLALSLALAEGDDVPDAEPVTVCDVEVQWLEVALSVGDPVALHDRKPLRLPEVDPVDDVDNEDVTEAVDDTDLWAVRVDDELRELRVLNVNEAQVVADRDDSVVADERKDEDREATPERVAELDAEERGDALLAALDDADVESDEDALGD